MQKVRAGVVGVGQMGQYHVGVYSELFNVELVGVAARLRTDGAQAHPVPLRLGVAAHLDESEAP